MSKDEKVPIQDARKLEFPARTEGEVSAIKVFTLPPPPRAEPWPWRAMMLTAVNCYVLWIVFWLQFCCHIMVGSFYGNNIGYYGTTAGPFDMSAPESFLAIAVLYSVFALAAVIGGTWKTPRLWKRVFLTLLFCFFAIGGASLVLSLRHNSYAIAVAEYEKTVDRFSESLWSGMMTMIVATTRSGRRGA